jgi:hypothetical protein
VINVSLVCGMLTSAVPLEEFDQVMEGAEMIFDEDSWFDRITY